MSLAQTLSSKERSRWPPLTKMLMAGEMNGEVPQALTLRQKVDRWMVNEGYKRLFFAVFVISHAMVFAFGFMNYWIKDTLSNARANFGVTYAIARASALVLHFDVALILLPICRTLISLMRQTPLNDIIPFDYSMTFHKLVGASIFIFSWVHTVAHWNNFAQFAARNNLGLKGFLAINFKAGPAWTGYLMLIILCIIVFTSMDKTRRKNFERFWYMHHLFILFFVLWSVHGAFCMIKTDFAPFCSGTGVFWEYWMYGGFIYLAERAAREIRGRRRTVVTKVVQHPSNVVEIQIRKENSKVKAGQYILLCCPEISIWQFHPFTLTSAPEEDYLSLHIRCVGDFTKRLARVLGCDFSDEKRGTGSGDGTGTGNGKSKATGVVASSDANVDSKLRKVLPRLYIDGPFGSASEDVFKFEIAVLIGAGIGVTPFASILKSIWYRMNYPQGKTRLQKVYFIWVCRDFGSFEWFRSLLLAIEAQDVADNIEIHTYLTAKIRPDDATNIMINDANAEADSITGLRAPTNFGRPNWDAIFKGVRKIHSPAEAGVFYCGPPQLSSTIQLKCNLYSEPGFNFVWGNESF